MEVKSGDQCPNNCGGRLHVRNSKNRGSIQVQYLECCLCKSKPANNKVIVESGAVRRRAAAAVLTPSAP